MFSNRIKLKYVISYLTKFGSISAESKRPQELVEVYPELKRLAAKIDKNSSKKGAASLELRQGKGETTEILKAIESDLLTADYFLKPRTTGETRDKLSQITKRKFTSRKVSQALGILREKGVLHRTGRRNFFKYSTG